jgi:hypothetical protein
VIDEVECPVCALLVPRENASRWIVVRADGFVIVPGAPPPYWPTLGPGRQDWTVCSTLCLVRIAHVRPLAR